MVWDECERRYEGLSRKAITIRLPYFERLDARQMKATILDALDAQPWPEYLKAWHKAHVKIVTESQPSIEDILCNVTKPWMPHEGCPCAAIKARLSKKRQGINLPEIDSHLFFISRDYQGPNEGALRVGGNNTPRQSMWDMKRAWEAIGKQLPGCLGLTAKQWTAKLSTRVYEASST